MTGEFTDDRLEAVVRSIGDHLEVPQVADTEAAITSPRRRPPTILAVAAAVAAIVVGVVLVPSTRAAVAEWLGIGSTRIEITGEEAVVVDGLDHIAEGLHPTSVDEAEQAIGRALPDTSATALGPPDAVYPMPEGGVLLAWKERDASLWIRADTHTEILFDKLVGSGQDIKAVDDLGQRALLVTNTHILQTPQRRLAARTVVLWNDGTHEYRLEAALDGAALVDLARSIP